MSRTFSTIKSCSRAQKVIKHKCVKYNCMVIDISQQNGGFSFFSTNSTLYLYYTYLFIFGRNLLFNLPNYSLIYSCSFRQYIIELQPSFSLEKVFIKMLIDFWVSTEYVSILDPWNIKNVFLESLDSSRTF